MRLTTSLDAADKAREIALMLVSRRFNRVPQKLRDKICFLNEWAATDLAASILDIKTVKQLEKWVDAHSD